MFRETQSSSKLNFAFVFFSVTSSFLTMGCSEEQEFIAEGSRIFAVSLSDSMNPECLSFEEDLKREGLARAITVRSSDSHGDPSEQVTFINECVDSQVHALFVMPVEGESLDAVLAPSRWRRTVVFAIGEDIDSDVVASYIGTDHEQVGRVAADWIKEQVGANARIAFVEADGYSLRTKGNVEGFLARVGEFEGMEIVWRAQVEESFEGGYDGIESLLKSRIPVDVVFALSDSMAIGAREAADREDALENVRWICIGGRPGPDGGCQAVLDRKLDAAIRYPSPATSAIDSAIKLLGSRVEPPRRILLEPIIISSRNASAFDTR